jgi:hypothetical protein
MGVDRDGLLFVCEWLGTGYTVSKFYKNLVKWALTEMLCSVAGTTTLDREWYIPLMCVGHE